MFDLPVRLEVCENEWKVQAWIGPGLVVTGKLGVKAAAEAANKKTEFYDELQKLGFFVCAHLRPEGMQQQMHEVVQVLHEVGRTGTS